ncbi:MAG: LPXTG cell wall anchor domain-containing protein [Oscillospiraceae bacterium]|nr:LPXTG cell wall anchor domain-containing protein [Oscillospiraceae bacterium]
MKKFKSFLAIVLAIAMLLSLATGVSADETTYTITITNTQKNVAYSAYKIFDAVYDSTADGYTYSIAADNQFLNFVKQYSNLQDGTSYTMYFTLHAKSDGGYYVVPTDDFEIYISDFAADLKTEIEDDSSSYTADATDTVGASGKQITLDVTSSGAGYYFVNTSLGSLAFLDTVPDGENSTITIEEKNGIPSVKKQVSDDGEDYVTYNDAAIGDTLYYKTVVSNVYSVSNLVIHDCMETSITWNENSLQVYLLPSADTELSDTYLLTSGTDYSVSTGGEHTDENFGGWSGYAKYDCTFEVTILKDLTKVEKDAVIVLTYTATVPTGTVFYDASKGTNVNDNFTCVSYGNDLYTSTSGAHTYVYSMAIYKYTTEDNGTAKTALSGVEFKLKNADGKYAVVNGSNGTYTIKEWTDDSSATGTTLTTASGGTIIINGLDGDTVYYLTETKTLDGYNMLTGDIMFKIVGCDSTTGKTTEQEKVYTSTDGTTWTSTNATQTINSVTYNSLEIENNAGAELPETGGVGLLVVYAVGGMLVAVAIMAGLILKKRRKI